MKTEFTLTQKRALAVATVIAILYAAYFLRRYFILIVVAAVVVYLFSPLYNRLTKRMGTGLSATLTLLAVFAWGSYVSCTYTTSRPGWARRHTFNRLTTTNLRAGFTPSLSHGNFRSRRFDLAKKTPPKRVKLLAYGVIRTAGDRGDRGAVQLALTIRRVLAGQGSIERLQMTPPYRADLWRTLP